MFGGISFCFWDLVLFNTWMTFVELLCRLVLIFFFKKISDQKICLIPPPPRRKHMNALWQSCLQEAKIFCYPLGLKLCICSSMWWMFSMPPMMTDVRLYQGHSFTVFWVQETHGVHMLVQSRSIVFFIVR